MHHTNQMPAYITYPERMIIAAILDEAFARGWLVAVYDGEDWAVMPTDDRAHVERNIGATDTTTLRFRNPKERDERNNAPKIMGSVFLVHGNGSEVIADHTDTERMIDMLAKASGLADTFHAAGV